MAKFKPITTPEESVAAQLSLRQTPDQLWKGQMKEYLCDLVVDNYQQFFAGVILTEIAMLALFNPLMAFAALVGLGAVVGLELFT